MDWVIYMKRKLIMHETTFDNFDTENKINNLMFFIQKKKTSRLICIHSHEKKNEMK
jgi:hypothetical protein